MHRSMKDASTQCRIEEEELSVGVVGESPSKRPRLSGEFNTYEFFTYYKDIVVVVVVVVVDLSY